MPAAAVTFSSEPCTVRYPGCAKYDLKTWILVAVPLAVAAAAEGAKEPAAFAAAMTAYTAYLVGIGIGHCVLGAGYGPDPARFSLSQDRSG